MADIFLHEIALTQVKGIGDLLIKKLISHFGDAKTVLTASRKDLLRVPLIGQKTVHEIKNEKHLFEAEKIIEKSLKEVASLIFYTSEDYPKRLKRFDDAPCLLYYKGNINLSPKKTVGIVGTRNATRYGKEITQELISELKEINPVIISGLAYGIDIEAHKSALANRLNTIGVMASGVNNIYPKDHSSVAKEMINNGGLLSENGFDASPDAPKFPARNRIIAMLSDVVLVVEGAKKGGALITAEYSNNYNIDTMAVPGTINAKYSEGCNDLIKRHKAHIYTSPRDLIELKNWDLANTKEKQSPTFDLSTLEKDEQVIIESLINYKELTLDELSRISSLSLNNLAVVILNLEFKNLVSAKPGNKYTLSRHASFS